MAGDGAPEALTGELAAEVERFESAASQVDDRDAWEALRVRWIGRKQGVVRELLARLRDVPAEEKRAYGQGVNTLKEHVERRLDELAHLRRVGPAEVHVAVVVGPAAPVVDRWAHPAAGFRRGNSGLPFSTFRPPG